jgi:hypothetical protein
MSFAICNFDEDPSEQLHEPLFVRNNYTSTFKNVSSSELLISLTSLWMRDYQVNHFQKRVRSELAVLLQRVFLNQAV